MTPLRPRSAEPTGFSVILDAVVRDSREVLCAVFVDSEGETIDVATAIDEFDAKIAGAVLALPLAACRTYVTRRRAGRQLEVRVSGAQRSVIVRAVTAECDLVVLLDATITAALIERVVRAATLLARESGFEGFSESQSLRVVEHSSSEKGFPQVFVDGAAPRTVSAVLGVREETDRTHYLVRTDDGEEVLVVNDRVTKAWRRES